jgi:hypothetical protein
MVTIEAFNVQDALNTALSLFRDPRLTPLPSRNGPMLELPGPVVTHYMNPEEMVLLQPERDANPFFHFFEAWWMLVGSNKVGQLTPFVKRMADFSDDGQTLHGAYGHRWRGWFGFDQIQVLCDELRRDPDSRRAVLQMWSPCADLGREGARDLPCNLSCAFLVREGALNMTVFNRSNDAIWGAYGANAVHFGMLQAFMANDLGLDVGTYSQVSNSLHIYPELPVTERMLNAEPHTTCCPGVVLPTGETWELMHDAWRYVSHESMDWDPLTEYFDEVARPIKAAHLSHRRREWDRAMREAEHISAPDWRQACTEWLERRRGEQS